jgi:GNAT superfamily N-acetyltransferase
MALFNPIAHNKTMKIQKWNKKDHIFDQFLDAVYLTMDHCEIYYVEDKGFCVLNHKPKYKLYKRLGIAEIQDVFVLPDHRGKGVATTLIKHCETICNNDVIGISVPVSPEFGAAQRLYAKLNYVPDGNGMTYDREPVQSGGMVRADENLCLMLVKDLKPNEGQANIIT